MGFGLSCDNAMIHLARCLQFTAHHLNSSKFIFLSHSHARSATQDFFSKLAVLCARQNFVSSACKFLKLELSIVRKHGQMFIKQGYT